MTDLRASEADLRDQIAARLGAAWPELTEDPVHLDQLAAQAELAVQAELDQRDDNLAKMKTVATANAKLVLAGEAEIERLKTELDQRTARAERHQIGLQWLLAAQEMVRDQWADATPERREQIWRTLHDTADTIAEELERDEGEPFLALLDQRDTEIERLRAAFTEIDAAEIERIQAQREAMPTEERHRRDAFDAPMLRFQLAAWVSKVRTERERAETAEAELATAKEAFEAAIKSTASDAMQHRLCSLDLGRALQRAEAAEAERDQLRADLREARLGWSTIDIDNTNLIVRNEGALRLAESEISQLRQRAEAAEAERDQLNAAVDPFLTAQGQMLDGWAEASPDRKAELWERLHETAEALRDTVDHPETTRLIAAGSLGQHEPPVPRYVVERTLRRASEIERDQLLALVRELVDREPCADFDHHGGCQTHSGSTDCVHGRARKLLAALDQTEEADHG